MVELAGIVALEPKLLLLDEPSSGVSQRETEALAGLLEGLKAQLDLTPLIIEHDIPLVMGLSDRILAMDTGMVVTIGQPEDVRAHPRVVESYPGGNVAASARSDAAR